MQAEQLLEESFIYEQPDQNDLISRQAARLLGQSTGPNAADSEAENEISIPQESSIAGSISMQHQRRATGAAGALVHAPQVRQGSTQFQVGSGLGQSKSSPSLAGGGKGDSTGGLKRINQNND